MRSKNTTKGISSKLFVIGNNIKANPALKTICIEAADRLNLLQKTLQDLLEDTDLASPHACEDIYCPRLIARHVVCLGKE
jgi:hypothetical protein